MEILFFLLKSIKCFLPFLFAKLSGSSVSGKNKNDIFFSGNNSFIELYAALNAALKPLSSPSKQIITSSKN